MTKLPRLTKTEVKVLEAGMNFTSYVEAAHAIEIDERTFYSIIYRVKQKIKNAKRFLYRCRKYEKMLFGEKEEWESV